MMQTIEPFVIIQIQTNPERRGSGISIVSGFKKDSTEGLLHTRRQMKTYRLSYCDVIGKRKRQRQNKINTLLFLCNRC